MTTYQHLAAAQADRYRRHAARVRSAAMLPLWVLAGAMPAVPAIDHTARKNAARRAKTTARHDATTKARAAAWGF
jgi:hypothetical protein